MSPTTRVVLMVAGLLAIPRRESPAQMHHTTASATDATPGASVSLRAQAIGLVTRVDPALGGQAFTEGYLTQPLLMARAHALDGTLGAIVTLDLEGWTLQRGQLNPGIYGEGYVDRRHPHTYVHEAIGVIQGSFAGTRVSVSGGKGFVPFGTDDPMMRPFAAYPVNHHLAQILERYVAAVAVHRGPATFEGAVFNGDEPLSAGAAPNASRFGDSWAVRASVAARSDLELQASFASVASPELPDGDGLDQRKLSASARLARDVGVLRSALVEWALTDELFGDLRTARFTSMLAEASAGTGRTLVSARVENTTRPEEERLRNPFRTSRIGTDFGLLAITRWKIGTVAASYAIPAGAVNLAPFVEVSYARPNEEVTPSAFTPRSFYGASALWSTSAGLRVGIGQMSHRMGRYGAAALGMAAPPATRHTH